MEAAPQRVSSSPPSVARVLDLIGINRKCGAKDDSYLGDVVFFAPFAIYLSDTQGADSMTISNLFSRFTGLAAATTALLVFRARRSPEGVSHQRLSRPEKPPRSSESSWPPPEGVYWGM